MIVNLRRGPRLVLTAFFAAPALVGCAKTPPQLAPTKPTEVVVDRPVIREVTDYEDFTGRTEPTNTIDIRAQVTGYLDSVHFKDGADVQKDDLLFRIDPQTYEAAFDQARAGVAQAKAHLDRLNRDYQRMTRLRGTSAVSQEEVDRVSGDKEEAEAAVKAAEANLKAAETNLGYTTIRAKFSGRISRRAVYPGNVVKANDTLLTNLVALDPIYATFDVDERTMLRIRRLIRGGKVTSARVEPVHVQIGLADEESFSLSAPIEFVDNKVDPNTGTLKVRAIVANPKLLLSPGLFVRVRLPVGKPHPSLLVPEEALGSDQGQKFVFVVNDKDEVVYRRVVVGQQVDQFRVVESGLTANDRVIVKGLQRVRAGVKVAPRAAEPRIPVGPSPKAPDATAKNPPVASRDGPGGPTSAPPPPAGPTARP